jgi:hypothetical protein
LRLTVVARRSGDLISGRNDGKGSHAITGKVESASEYSAQTAEKQQHAGLLKLDAQPRLG